jgi:hypothetical protein
VAGSARAFGSPPGPSSGCREPRDVQRCRAVRYEVAADTHLAFHSRRHVNLREGLPEPETVAIEFEGRRFVWHENEHDVDGTEYMPTVTTMVADPGDYASEREAVERFFSALAYSTRTPIEAFTSGGAGWKQEMDSPFVRQPRRGLAHTCTLLQLR